MLTLLNNELGPDSLKIVFENFFKNFFVTLRKRTFPVRIPFFKEDVDSHGKKRTIKKFFKKFFGQRTF